jgi:hypothetical protein
VVNLERVAHGAKQRERSQVRRDVTADQRS